MRDYVTFHQLHYQPQPLILANVWNEMDITHEDHGKNTDQRDNVVRSERRGNRTGAILLLSIVSLLQIFLPDKRCLQTKITTAFAHAVNNASSTVIVTNIFPIDLL